MHLKSRIRRLLALASEFGLEPRKTARSAKHLAKYITDYRLFAQLSHSREKLILRPALGDGSAATGSIRGHYFHQDLHVAQKVFDANPSSHLDVGSRIDGFVAHVASFREVRVLDIRPAEGSIPNVIFQVLDICEELPGHLRESTESLSCLHALEHFGLGRYGDAIDPCAYLRGFDNLEALLQRGGQLYLSVPIGSEPRIEFNAHRVFSLPQILGLFSNRFAITSVSYIDDRGEFHVDVDWLDTDANNSFGCEYGCAIIEATKLGTNVG